jgi:TIR domain
MVCNGIRGPSSLEEADSPIRVFCAYSHKDENLRGELESHLAVLRRAGLIEPWYDGRILPGTKWEEQILKHLSDSELILLLVSSDFLASQYCCDVEMRQALERHYAGDASVIPIILRPVAWRLTELARLQVLPKGGRPIFGPDTDQPSRDQAFVETCEGILAVLMNRGQRTAGRTTPWMRPRLPQSRSRKRVLDAAIPSRIPVGKATMVVVQVRRQDSSGLGGVVELETTYPMTKDDVVSKPIRVQFPVDAHGSLQPMGLSLVIQSPDFEPPTQTKGIQVPVRGDSEPRVLLLTAKRMGSLLVNVEVYRDDGALVSGCILSTNAEESEGGICRLQHVTSFELTIAEAQEGEYFRQDDNTEEQEDPAFLDEGEKKPTNPFPSSPASLGSNRPAFADAPFPPAAPQAQPAESSARPGAGPGEFTQMFNPLGPRPTWTATPRPPPAPPAEDISWKNDPFFRPPEKLEPPSQPSTSVTGILSSLAESGGSPSGSRQPEPTPYRAEPVPSDTPPTPPKPAEPSSMPEGGGVTQRLKRLANVPARPSAPVAPAPPPPPVDSGPGEFTRMINAMGTKPAMGTPAAPPQVAAAPPPAPKLAPPPMPAIAPPKSKLEAMVPILLVINTFLLLLLLMVVIFLIKSK